MSSSESSATPLDSQIDVRLDNFEGPLDLLLYLIRKNDLDVYDIPIAQITQEYLGYLDLMKTLNLETAGEFLVMASTLMQIKAQMLLPAPEVESDEGPDPRSELVNKLLEYQQFKEAASILGSFNERAKDVYYRHLPPAFGEEDFTLKASVFDLLGAFKRVLEQAPKEVGQVLREEITIEAKIREILDALEQQPSVAFEDLFAHKRRRLDLIVTFMALLELIRLKQIVARQADIFGSIRIYRADAAPAEQVPQEAEPTPAPAPSKAPWARKEEKATSEETMSTVAVPENSIETSNSVTQTDAPISEEQGPVEENPAPAVPPEEPAHGTN